MKRISMAGADVAVTDDVLADLVLEYANQLGKVGTTDTITIPTARNGRAEEASFLLGPASQIALMPNDEPDLERVDLPGLDDVCRTVQRRIDRLLGRGPLVVQGEALALPGADLEID